MALLMPPADQDPIIRLHDYYFQSCDFMFKNTEKLRGTLKIKGKLSQNKTVEMQSFFQLWIATLCVTAEGFQNERITKFFERFEKVELRNQDSQDIELRRLWDSVRHRIKERMLELHSYRNITFHFQDTMSRLLKKREEFLHYDAPVNSIDWAYDLHIEIRSFFSMYRPVSSAMYMIKKYNLKSSDTL